MSNHDHLDTEIHELNTRMALVEKDLALIAGMRKWVVTGVIAIVLQAGGVLYTYGQLTERVELLTGSNLPRDVSTALRVLADHGTEMENIRLEQARIRERVDVVSDRDYMESNKLEDRIARMELKIFQ